MSTIIIFPFRSNEDDKKCKEEATDLLKKL